MIDNILYIILGILAVLGFNTIFGNDSVLDKIDFRQKEKEKEKKEIEDKIKKIEEDLKKQKEEIEKTKCEIEEEKKRALEKEKSLKEEQEKTDEIIEEGVKDEKNHVDNADDAVNIINDIISDD